MLRTQVITLNMYHGGTRTHIKIWTSQIISKVQRNKATYIEIVMYAIGTLMLVNFKIRWQEHTIKCLYSRLSKHNVTLDLYNQKVVRKLCIPIHVQHMILWRTDGNYTLIITKYCPNLAYCSLITVMILIFWTDRSGQTVQTQIRLLLSGSSLFAIPFAPFWQNTFRFGLFVLNFRWITAKFLASQNLGTLR